MVVEGLERETVEAPSARARRGVTLRLARFPPARNRNPYFRLLYDALSTCGVDVVAEPDLSFRWLWRARGDVDILHFHWRPDRYYACRPEAPALRSWLRLAAFDARLRLAHLLGYRIVWTIHEVFPPGAGKQGETSRRAHRRGGCVLARRSDLLLCHDAVTRERACAEFGRPAERAEVIPHGAYLDVYPRGRSRAEVRQGLGIAPDAFTFLCFGALRADKHVGLVLEAFALTRDPSLVLLVAGDAEDAGSRRDVLAAAATDPRIKPMLRFVPHDDVRELFEAADASVIGRSEAWTSGSLILSLSLGLPVVAADLAPYDELLDNGGAGWLFRPGNAESLRAALEAASADRSTARANGAMAIRQAELLPSWSEIASRTAELMVAASPARRQTRRTTDAITGVGAKSRRQN